MKFVILASLLLTYCVVSAYGCGPVPPPHHKKRSIMADNEKLGDNKKTKCHRVKVQQNKEVCIGTVCNKRIVFIYKQKCD